MATKSVKTISQNCLGGSSPRSILRDVLGVYGTDNPLTRSLKERLNWIENDAFIRVALVTIQGASPSLQRDLDNANLVYHRECGVWIYCTGHIIANAPTLLNLDQNDCWDSGHSVSDEEDDLYDLGRNQGASIVAYFINGASGTNWRGCAAHPTGRRGFWVGSTATRWTFVHELTHVVGNNGHKSSTDNLMISNTGTITNPPPDLNSDQCGNINRDPAIESCS